MAVSASGQSPGSDPEAFQISISRFPGLGSSEAAWRWIDPIFEAWNETNQPVRNYTAGTWGPSQAIALIERDGRTWNDGDE